MRYFLNLFLSFILMVGLTTIAFSQTSSIDISIDMVPINPDPGKNVSLSASSYAIDLNQTNLIWNYNGKVIESGIGKTKISVIAPSAGQTGIVTVSVNGTGLSTGSASVFLRPASVDVLWEAVDSYTPPFYKGKALLPPGGNVRVTAIPSYSAPKNLSYSWSRNGSAVPSLSGLGKSSITLDQDILNERERIDLEIKNGSFNGLKSLTLSSNTPELIAYQNMEGFINYAKGFNKNINIAGGGVILDFEPYNFSVPRYIVNDLSINTTLDGQTIYPDIINEIYLSRPENGNSASLKMKVMTVVYSLQNLEKTFNLLFN